MIPPSDEDRDEARPRSTARSSSRSTRATSVAIQLKILTPVGTPIRNELSMKNPSTTIGTGEANMWCAQTSVARNAITAVDAAIAL